MIDPPARPVPRFPLRGHPPVVCLPHCSIAYCPTVRCPSAIVKDRPNAPLPPSSPRFTLVPPDALHLPLSHASLFACRCAVSVVVRLLFIVWLDPRCSQYLVLGAHSRVFLAYFAPFSIYPSPTYISPFLYLTYHTLSPPLIRSLYVIHRF